MANHLKLCFILLVVSAHNTLTSPVYTAVPPSTPPPLHILDDQGANPAPAVDLDGNPIECQNDAECQKSVLGPDSRCAGHHCECKIGAVPSPETKKCLGAVHNLGAGCQETWQCTRELGNQVECKDYLCTCVEGSKVVDGQCKKQIQLSGQCENNDECVGGRDTTCTDGICVCVLEKVPSPENDRCLPIATKFEDSCEESIQCTSAFGDGARCHDYKCSCSDDYHFNNNACLRNLNLDEPCESVHLQADCFLKSTGIERVECNGTCQCKAPYHPSSDKTECLAEGQTDGKGDAASLSPIFAVIVSIMLARLVAS